MDEPKDKSPVPCVGASPSTTANKERRDGLLRGLIQNLCAVVAPVCRSSGSVKYQVAGTLCALQVVHATEIYGIVESQHRVERLHKNKKRYLRKGILVVRHPDACIYNIMPRCLGR